MTEALDSNAGDAVGPAVVAVRPSEPPAEGSGWTPADTRVGETGDGGGDSFPRPVVERLRTEAAENRVRAQEQTARADAAVDALYKSVRELATAGILWSPLDLPDDGDYLNDQGLPDVAKMREAALRLAEERPYLAKARGPIGQGPRAQAPEAFSLAGALRQAAR